MTDAATLGTAPAEPTVDARPVLMRHRDSLWSRAADERTRVARALEGAAAKSMRDGVVTRSNEGDYPVWVSLEHWLRSGSTTERVRVHVAITPCPQHRYPLVYDVTITDRGRVHRPRRYGALGDTEIGSMVAGLAADTYAPGSRHRLRTAPWMVWLNPNPMVGVMRDWLRVARNCAAVLTVATLILAIADEEFLLSIDELRGALIGRLNEVQQSLISIGAVAAALFAARRRPGSKLAKASLAAAAAAGIILQPGGILLAAALGSADPFSDAGEWNFMPFMGSAAVFAALFMLDKRRVTVVHNEGRPIVEPRSLVVADYWHAVLDGIGDASAEIRARFLAAFSDRPHDALEVGSEVYVSIGPDGQEAREQLVFTFRRALVYCQIYQYGSNLYVGWDAYLNAGHWQEYEVGRGMLSRRTKVSIRSVRPGLQKLSEYDLHDLNCLVEWVHGRLVNLAKAVLAERAIDLELNFAIQRAERQTLLSSGETAAPARGLRVMRTG